MYQVGQGGRMEIEDFLLEDYKLKVEYYAGHLSRMWTRFNFLLTIDAGLFGLFATRQNLLPATRQEFLLIGLVLSGVWLVFGVLDFCFIVRYTNDIRCAYNRLDLPRGYTYAGETGPFLRYVSPVAMAMAAPLAFLLIWGSLAWGSLAFFKLVC
jgi:hypothetical protein